MNKGRKDTIIEAIETKTAISFLYANKWSNYQALRNVAPLALGVLRKSGQWCLRGYLLNDASFHIAKSSQKYRLYLLNRIQGVQLLPYKFETPVLYRKNDRALGGTLVQLSETKSDVFIPYYQIA